MQVRTRVVTISDTPVELRRTFGALVEIGDTYFIDTAWCGGADRVVVVTKKGVFVCSRTSKVKSVVKMATVEEVQVAGCRVTVCHAAGSMDVTFETLDTAAKFATALSTRITQGPEGNLFISKTPMNVSRRTSTHPPPSRHESPPPLPPMALTPAMSVSSDQEDCILTPDDLPDEILKAKKGSLEVVHGPPCVITDRRGNHGSIVAWKGQDVCGVAEIVLEDDDTIQITRVAAVGGGWSAVKEFVVRGTFPFDMEKGEEVMRGGEWSFERRDVKRSKIRGIFRVLDDKWKAVIGGDGSELEDPPFFGEKTVSRENSVASSLQSATPPSIPRTRSGTIKRRPPSIIDSMGGTQNSTEFPEEGEPKGPAKSPMMTSVMSPYTPQGKGGGDTVVIACKAGTPLGVVVHKEKMVLSKVEQGSVADEAGAAAYVGREILLVNGSPFDDVGEALDRRVAGVLTITFGGVKDATPPPIIPSTASEPDKHLPPSSPTHSQGRSTFGRSSETGLQYVGYAALPTDLREIMSKLTAGRTLALHFCATVMQSGSTFESSKRRILLVTQPCIYLFRPQGTVSRYIHTADIAGLMLPEKREDWLGIKSRQHNDVLVRLVEGPEMVKKLMGVIGAVYSAVVTEPLKIFYDQEDVPGKLNISKADWGLRPNVPPIPCLSDDHAQEVAVMEAGGVREGGFIQLIASSWRPNNKLTSLPPESAYHIQWLLEYGIPDISYCCTTGGEHPGVCILTPEAVYSFSSSHRVLLEYQDISEILITSTSLILFSEQYHTLKLPGLEDVDETFEALRRHHPTVATTKRRERIDDGIHKSVKCPVPIPVYVFINSSSTRTHILKLDETMGIHYQEAQRSVAIVGVDEGSNAMKAGMRENTTILTADERAVHTIDDLKAIMMSAIAEKRNKITIETLDTLPSALDPATGGLPSPRRKSTPPPIGYPPIEEATNLPYAMQERFTLALMKASSSVFYMGLVKKIGAKRSQSRVLILSEKVLYLTDPNGSVKRAVRISNIRELLTADSRFMAFRVPSDYDLLLQVDSQDQAEEVATIMNILSALYRHATTCMLVKSHIIGRPLKSMLVLKKPDWVRKAVKKKKKQDALIL